MVEEFPLKFYKEVWNLKDFLKRKNINVEDESDEYASFLKNVVVAELDDMHQRHFWKKKAQQKENAKENLDNLFWIRNKHFKHIQTRYGKEICNELKGLNLFEEVDGIGWIQRTGDCADRFWKKNAFYSYTRDTKLNIHSGRLEVSSKAVNVEERNSTFLNKHDSKVPRQVPTVEDVSRRDLAKKKTVVTGGKAEDKICENTWHDALQNDTAVAEAIVDIVDKVTAEDEDSCVFGNSGHLKRKKQLSDIHYPIQKKLCVGKRSVVSTSNTDEPAIQLPTKGGICGNVVAKNAKGLAPFISNGSFEYINRKWFLYSRPLKERSQVSKTCVYHFGYGYSKCLIRKMFGLSGSRSLDSYEDIAVNDLLKTVELFMKKEKQFAYVSSLSHHCPVRISEKSQDLESLLQQQSSHNQVYCFLRAVCYKVIPKEMFGCHYNQRLFEKRMKCLITAGINDKIRVDWFFDSFKVESCSWILYPQQFKQNEKYLKALFSWLASYLLYVLRTYFYITECANMKLMLVYYRKSVWKKIERKAVIDMISSNKLEEIPQESLREAVKNLQGKVRFIPKHNTVRTVVSTKNQKSKQTDKKCIAAVLQYLEENHSFLKGSSCSNANEIHSAFKKFQTERDKNKKIYGVTVDIQDCFGSVNHDLLLDLVHLLPQFEGNIFRLHKYVILEKCGENLRKKNVLVASSKGISFEEHLLSKYTAQRASSTVYIDKSKEKSFHLNLHLNSIMKYISESVVQIEDKFYKVKDGLIQGGNISPHLCNMYISMFEAGIMGDLGKVPGEMLIRTMDDFLFLTQDKERADSFLRQVTFGIPEFNLNLNRRKMVANFISSVSGVKILKGNERLKWNGLEIDLENLSIYNQHSEFENSNVQYTVSLDTNCSGNELKRRTLLCLSLPPVLLDSDLNGDQVVIWNIYKKFSITAKKFHCLIMNSLPKNRNHGDRVLFGIIRESALRLFKNTEKTKKKVNIPSKMSVTQFYWLCYKAHVNTLQKYFSVHSSLIYLLKREIRFQEMRLETPITSDANLIKRCEVGQRPEVCKQLQKLSKQATKEQKPVLVKAIENRQAELVTVLLENGADPEVTDAAGDTAIHVAVKTGQTNIVVLILKYNVNVNTSSKVSGLTPLHYAAYQRNAEVIRKLVLKGADVNATTNEGVTPLMIVCKYSCPELAKFLLENGADATRKDERGYSAADYAIISGVYDELKDLLDESRTLKREYCKVCDIREVASICQTSSLGSVYSGDRPYHLRDFRRSMSLSSQVKDSILVTKERMSKKQCECSAGEQCSCSQPCECEPGNECPDCCKTQNPELNSIHSAVARCGCPISVQSSREDNTGSPVPKSPTSDVEKTFSHKHVDADLLSAPISTIPDLEEEILPSTAHNLESEPKDYFSTTTAQSSTRMSQSNMQSKRSVDYSVSSSTETITPAHPYSSKFLFTTDRLDKIEQLAKEEKSGKIKAKFYVRHLEEERDTLLRMKEELEQALNAALGALKDNDGRFNQHQDELNHLEHKVNVYTTQNENLRGSLRQSEDDSKKKDQQNNLLRQEKNALEKRIRDLEKNLNDEKAAKKDLEDEMHALNDDLDRLRNNEDGLTNQLQDLVRDIDGIVHPEGRSSSHIESTDSEKLLEELAHGVTLIINEVGNFKDKMDEKEREIGQLKREQEQLKAGLRNAKAENDKKTNDALQKLQSAQSSKQRLLGEVSDLEEQLEDAKRKADLTEALSGDNRNLKAERDHLLQELKSESKNHKALAKHVKDMESEIDRLLVEIARLRDCLKGAKRQHEKAESKVHELHEEMQIGRETLDKCRLSPPFSRNSSRDSVQSIGKAEEK